MWDISKILRNYAIITIYPIQETFMLEILTVSFFGHRIIQDFLKVESKVEDIVKDLIYSREYVDFLVGRNGDFDRIVSSSVIRIKRKVFAANSSHICVLPYKTVDIEYLIRYYDEVEICEVSAGAFPRAAIEIRNKYMVDRSDIVICYVEKETGGAYRAMKYAKETGKRVINLYHS